MAEESEGSEGRRRKPDWWRYTNASSVGIEMAVAMVMGYLAGAYIENNYTHWAPWTSLIGLGFGIGAAVLAVLRTARDYKADLAAEREAKEREKASVSEPQQ